MAVATGDVWLVLAGSAGGVATAVLALIEGERREKRQWRREDDVRRHAVAEAQVQQERTLFERFADATHGLLEQLEMFATRPGPQTMDEVTQRQRDMDEADRSVAQTLNAVRLAAPRTVMTAAEQWVDVVTLMKHDLEAKGPGGWQVRTEEYVDRRRNFVDAVRAHHRQLLER